MNTSLARKNTSSARPRRAKKSLGQHFLRDEHVVVRIVDALDIGESNTVFEIGPGEGILTRELSRRAGRVVAIELDDHLAIQLRHEFQGSHVEIVHADALELDPADLLRPEERFALAGNLPYNVAQPLLRHYLEGRPQPDAVVIMVQAEVADSIVAKPGRMTVLGVSVQLYGEPEILFRVPPAAFDPPPRVQSAVVRIAVAGVLRTRVDDVGSFFRVVRAGFSRRRKQLRNSLANAFDISPSTAEQILRDAGIQPTLRAQALTLDDWADLADAWSIFEQQEAAHAE